MINHRGPEFARLITSVTADVKHFYRTTHDLFFLTASGTGGLEAAIVNFFSPGDRVLCVSVGVFGDRFGTIAEVFGLQVDRLSFPYGQAADPQAVAEHLRAHPAIAAVLVTHNETSTGVTNDLEAIAREVKGAGKLLLVDAISSVGSIPLHTDEWGCDVVVSATQKSWMAPPGLATISVSPAAWEAHARARLPRFYWDLSAARRYLERGQTPWTPAVSVLFALEAALAMMKEEGREAIELRHARVGEFTRRGVRELGLELFADPAHASNTVTAIRVPSGVDARAVLRILREQHGIVLAGGQGKLDGQIWRIGHMGWVEERDIAPVIAALREVLHSSALAPGAV